jgi:hypothetical protein
MPLRYMANFKLTPFKKESKKSTIFLFTHPGSTPLIFPSTREKNLGLCPLLHLSFKWKPMIKRNFPRTILCHNLSSSYKRRYNVLLLRSRGAHLKKLSCTTRKLFLRHNKHAVVQAMKQKLTNTYAVLFYLKLMGTLRRNCQCTIDCFESDMRTRNVARP